MAHGRRFQAIDLRWGNSDEATLDQQTMNICLGDLRRCQQVSPKPNFIVLLGNRYGWQPLPPQIDAVEFEALLALMTEDELRRLCFDEANPSAKPGAGNGWYRRDDNTVPAEYVLLAREHESVFAEFEVWEREERELLTTLRRAVVHLYPNEDDVRRNRYFQSATHQGHPLQQAQKVKF